MSHVATVDLKITDLDALEVVCERLGLELVREQKTYAWWGTSVGDYALPKGMTTADLGKCAHAIRVKGTTPRNGHGGPWEIGLVQQPDGSFLPVYDFFGSAGDALHAKTGRGLTTLKAEMAQEVSVRILQRQGYRVTVGRNAQGERQVVAQKA
jgi:hypothetical protein